MSLARCFQLSYRMTAHHSCWLRVLFRRPQVYLSGLRSKHNAPDPQEAAEQLKRSQQHSKKRLQDITDYYNQYEREYMEPISEQHQHVPKEIDGEVENNLVEVVDVVQSAEGLSRATEGVFNVDELVSLLKQEKAQDVVVIALPAELRYAEYMVIVSVMSPRHMEALVQVVNQMYKRMKTDHDDYLHIEGKDSVTWRAIDFSNIVLHVMMPAVRQQYDIETLWTVGAEFDELTHTKSEADKWQDLLKDYSVTSSNGRSVVK